MEDPIGTFIRTRQRWFVAIATDIHMGYALEVRRHIGLERPMLSCRSEVLMLHCVEQSGHK